MTDQPKIVGCPACASLNRVPAGRKSNLAKCGRCGAALFQQELVTLTSVNFDAHAVKSDVTLVVDFWAGWCGPCRQMAPAFAAAAGQLEPDMRLGKLDTEAEPALSARYAIRSLPTLSVILHGQEVARQSGAMPTNAIVSWARQALERRM